MWSGGKRKPSKSKIPAELREINRLTPEDPLTHEDRVELFENVMSDIEYLQISIEFQEEVLRDIGGLAVADFESPIDTDDFYGGINRDRQVILRGLPTRQNFDRVPPRPKFST